jgi:hypothetical protein
MDPLKTYWQKRGEFENFQKQLFDIGFKNSFPFSNETMVRYKSPNGNSFDVYLDFDKPNKVVCLRGKKEGSIIAYGLIGNFVGGKGRYRKFSFKTPQQLKEKLDNWIL